MNRSTRTTVVILVATLTAAIASYGVYVAVKSIPVREVEVAHRYIAVASKTLPTGSRVTSQDVKLVAWPQNSPIAGSFDKIEPVLNRGLLSGVVENEPLTESKLAPIESGAGLPPTIPEGMRAMSVKVDEVIGVAGFVVPGTRVDVVVTLRGNGGNDQAMARTVVSDVLVLTSGTRYDQEQAKDGKPLPSTVVTLAVAPNDAERIALAGAEGQISLALRNPMDKTPTETSGVRIAGLMGSQAPAASSRAPQRVPPPVTPVIAPPVPEVPAIYTVETIRAAKRTEEVVH